MSNILNNNLDFYYIIFYILFSSIENGYSHYFVNGHFKSKSKPSDTSSVVSDLKKIPINIICFKLVLLMIENLNLFCRSFSLNVFIYFYQEFE